MQLCHIAVLTMQRTYIMTLILICVLKVILVVIWIIVSCVLIDINALLHMLYVFNITLHP